MNKIAFRNPDGIYTTTLDGHQYKIEIMYATSFSIQDSTRFQLGSVRVDHASGEYIEVVAFHDDEQPVIAQIHISTWEHGIYDSDCIRWAIAQLVEY